MRHDKIVFSDLDGTILDKVTYSYNESLESIQWLKQNKIPLIFCSAKTRAEVKNLKKEIWVEDPYIVENGSAILIPKDYFPFPVGQEHLEEVKIELGARLENFQSKARTALDAVGVKYESFAEMTPESVSRHTGLSFEQSVLAMEREYTMTLVLSAKEDLERARKAIESNGLTCFSGGRTLTVGDGGNKGRAVRMLIDLFARTAEITSYAFGDGENDVSMLREVDFPILVQSSSGFWSVNGLKKIIRVPLVGPAGFAKGVEEIVKPSG